MSKPRSVVADYAVYLVLRVFVTVVQALSFRMACAFAGGLAWLIYRVDRRHRLVALENLEHAFPGKYTVRERDALVRGVYRHFCSLLMEIIHLPRMMNVSNWKRYLALPNAGPLVDCLLSGRPLLIVTGHFGNWELAGYALGLLGFRTHAIARPLDNPFVDRFLRYFRERTGQQLLAKHGDFDRLQGILAAGGVVATLGDQDAGQRGLFVDFFNRPASTHKAIALLAIEHRVPMAVIAVVRIDGIYHVRTADVIYPEDYDDRPNAVREITQRFTTALEGLIRQHPEQYFWLHRRWKHQPPQKKNKRAA